MYGMARRDATSVRLCVAADALLDAFRNPHQGQTDPIRISTAVPHPDKLEGWTRAELTAALAFLVRMGLADLEP
jgi:hypothetical protein